jgi:hypothetical protein
VEEEAVSKTRVASKKPTTPIADAADHLYSPELFRYEAFKGHDSGDVLAGDAELLDELATAVECAALHARAIHGKAVA